MGWQFAVCTAGLGDAPRTAARLASHGVRAVEIGPAFLAENDLETVRRAGAAFLREGVAIRSVHAPFRGDIQLSAPEGPGRDRIIQFYEDFLPKAAAIGAGIIVVHAGKPAAASEHGAILVRAAGMLRHLAPQARELGLRFALENLPPGWPGSDPRQLAEIATALKDHPIGLCLDTGHAHMTGDLVKTFKVMKPHIIHFHLHDNDGTQDLHLPPPFGTIDWEAFLREWKDFPFDAPLVLECSAWGDEFIPRGRDEDFDLTRLLDHAREHFGHLSARLAREKEKRRENPGARVRGACPHRGDLTL